MEAKVRYVLREIAQHTSSHNMTRILELAEASADAVYSVSTPEEPTVAVPKYIVDRMKNLLESLR